MSNELSQYFSNEDENALWLMNELNRQSIFFIEEKETQRWVEDVIGPNFHGDWIWITSNPNHAKRFNSKFEAMTWMIQFKITFDKWCITEHQFI